MRIANFIAPPRCFVRHTAQRNFIGPGTIVLSNGDILMAAPWGRPPANFEQLAARFPLPEQYRSRDGGRTWNAEGPIDMDWPHSGMVSDGGISFIRLHDGRLAMLAHRHVEGLHGGGLPVIAFSSDEGKTWSTPQFVGESEGVWYVMNDRLLQMSRGTLVVPVSHMPQGRGTYEGDRNLGLCFFSHDCGQSWRSSSVPTDLDDGRGMAEPAVVEVRDGKLLMLARTGSGYLYRSWSSDAGDYWSKPEPTSLASACSSLTLRKLPDEQLIVFYNHAEPLEPGAFFPRTPLCYAVSPDGIEWSEPIVVDDSGVHDRTLQHIYPSVCFTPEGMVVLWSTHAANPSGSFTVDETDAWKIGGGMCAILQFPN